MRRGPWTVPAKMVDPLPMLLGVGREVGDERSQPQPLLEPVVFVADVSRPTGILFRHELLKNVRS